MSHSSLTDYDAEQTTLRYFSQRLIGIAPVYRLKGEGKDVPPIVKPFSGTLLIFEGAVSILTAGHVIADINAIYTNPQLDVETCLLVDNLGIEAEHDRPVPFDWPSAPKAFLDEDGLDFGVVGLRPWYVQQLMANGVRWVGEENWVHQDSLPRLDAYFLLGLPEELNPPRRQAPYDAIPLSQVMVRVELLDHTPEEFGHPAHPIFVGSLHDNLGISSVVGMSGGPIIGIRRTENGQLLYWVVALVRSCIASQRLVSGCPLPVLGSILRRSWNEILEESPEQSGPAR